MPISSQPVIGLFIAVALFAFGVVIIRRTALAERDPWLAKALTVCLLLHLICAPLQIWVVDHLYAGVADYNRYDAQGALLSNGFRHLDFSLAPGHLQGIVSDGAVSIVTGVVFAIIGVNQVGAFLLFSWLAFIGIIYFYRAFTITFAGAGSHRYGILIFFLPTLLFWTSDVSKEAIMTFLLGLTAYGCARILTYRSGGYRLVVACSAAGLFIRPNEVLLVLGGFTLAMLVRPAGPNVRFEGPRRTVALIVLGSMVGAAIFVSLHFLPGTHGSLSLTQINTNNSGTGAGYGSSNVGYSASVLDFPKDAYVVLFDPLPANAHGGGQWLSAIENTVLLSVVLLSLRQLRMVPRVSLARTYVTLCVVFTGGFLYAFAALGNLGLITRERTVMMPFFLVLLCIPRGPRHRPPRYQWELSRRARIERRRALAPRAVAVSTGRPPVRS
jgi:hypothetical protein